MLLMIVFRTTLMVGTVVLVFLSCWFPFAVWFALSTFSQTIKEFFNHDMVDFVIWLGKASFKGIIVMSDVQDTFNPSSTQ